MFICLFIYLFICYINPIPTPSHPSLLQIQFVISAKLLTQIPTPDIYPSGISDTTTKQTAREFPVSSDMRVASFPNCLQGYFASISGGGGF